MKIVAEERLLESFLYDVIGVGAISLFFFTLSIVFLFLMIKEKDKEAFIPFFFCLIISLFLFAALIDRAKEGIGIEYKAIVDDFNEVYKQGYRITGQEGELYILEKGSFEE